MLLQMNPKSLTGVVQTYQAGDGGNVMVITNLARACSA